MAGAALEDAFQLGHKKGIRFWPVENKKSGKEFSNKK